MSYSNIKRVLSVALLLAFTAPSTLAISGYDTVSTRSSMLLNSEVQLTENNETITFNLLTTQPLSCVHSNSVSISPELRLKVPFIL